MQWVLVFNQETNVPNRFEESTDVWKCAEHYRPPDESVVNDLIPIFGFRHRSGVVELEVFDWAADFPRLDLVREAPEDGSEKLR